MALTLQVSGESLSDCLARATCTLQPGARYELGQDVISSTASTIEVAPGKGAAVIDGSSRLDVHWEKCATKKGKKHPDCGAGVYVATLDGKIPYQLFFGSIDVETRSLLLPARWPNLPKKPTHYPEDAPSWSPAFDGRKSWSIVKTGEDKCAGPHADRTCKSKRLSSMDRGIIDDDGDANRTEEIETEEGDPIKVVINGPGALAKQKFSAKGATLLISFGKRLVEVGKVENHTEGDSNFTYHMPDCATSLYTSCGKKAKFMDVKYYLENAVALIDQRHEYAVELDDDGISSKLYMKFDKDEDLETLAGKLVTKKGMWARLKGSPDFAFDLAGITNAKVKGVTFFATSPLVSKRQNKVTLDGNTFLYPFASKRVAKDFSQPPLLTVNGESCVIENNVFKYGEGVVLTAGGESSVLKNNLFEWNGFLSTNGPQTIIYGQGSITRNTLLWNGQVSGFKLLGEGVNVQYNEVGHQNYGELLHDGAAFHVQTKAQDGTFSHNWIHDGHQSMGIRFDTASTTSMANIGRNGTLTNNVMWNTGMVLKGDDHRIERNTVFDASVMLVRAFGEQQGMNEATEMKDNLLSVAPVPRGKKWSGAGNTPNGLEVTLSGVSTGADCSWLSLSGKWGWLANDGFTADGTMTASSAIPKQAELREVVEPNGNSHDWDALGDTYKKRAALCQVLAQDGATLKFRTERRPKGPAWDLAQVPEDDNDITDACEEVRSCTLHDFRPHAASQDPHDFRPGLGGAYSSQDMKKSWIPGQQTSVPRQSSPTAGAAAVPAESSLIFLQAMGCESHTIELVEDAPGAAVKAESFTGGENVWEAPGLVANKKYQWRIQSRCEEKGFSDWQTFDTIPKAAGDNDDDDEDDDDDDNDNNNNNNDGSEASVEAELVKEKVQCKGSFVKLGYHDSLKACAATVHKAAAKYFAASEKTTGKHKGKFSCRLQGTNDAGCERFKTKGKWNFYKVKVLPCEDTAPWCSRKVAHCTKSNPAALMTQRKCPKTCNKCPALLATSATSSSQPKKRKRFLQQGLALIQQKRSMARKAYISDEL